MSDRIDLLERLIATPYVPSSSAVVALSDIVETFTVPTHEQDFVRGIGIGFLVQRVHHPGEALPQRPIASVGFGVCLVDQTEVDGGLCSTISIRKTTNHAEPTPT